MFIIDSREPLKLLLESKRVAGTPEQFLVTNSEGEDSNKRSKSMSKLAEDTVSIYT